MPKLFIQLGGGLGNQMFQYASGRGVAEKLGYELVLDTWSGFIRDSEYRRSYVLRAFPVKAREAHTRECWPVWLQRIEQKLRVASRRLSTDGLIKKKRLYGSFMLDDNQAFYPGAFEPIYNETWMIGCFQSPKYFDFIAAKILKELMPPKPSDPRVRALGERLRSQPTVALGIRLYEEAKDPAAHALGRREKSMGEIKAALEKLRERHPELKVALFCTQRARCLEELSLPDNTAFVTPEEGFQGALSRLWLLSQCRHHLFNNSSFYWWGAWLSAAVRAGEAQRIIAADNFINRDGLCASWERF